MYRESDLFKTCTTWCISGNGVSKTKNCAWHVYLLTIVRSMFLNKCSSMIKPLSCCGFHFFFKTRTTTNRQKQGNRAIKINLHNSCKIAYIEKTSIVLLFRVAWPAGQYKGYVFHLWRRDKYDRPQSGNPPPPTRLRWPTYRTGQSPR